MATLDLNIFPYEIYVNTSLEKPYHPKCDCICKDILVLALNDLLVIENFDKYDCYITGKINSSSPYPTFDCDLILTKTDKNDDELLELFKNIKLKGFERDINFDLKYMSSIEPFSNGVDNPDDFMKCLKLEFNMIYLKMNLQIYLHLIILLKLEKKET